MIIRSYLSVTPLSIAAAESATLFITSFTPAGLAILSAAMRSSSEATASLEMRMQLTLNDCIQA